MAPHRTAIGHVAASFVVIAVIVVGGLAFVSMMNGPSNRSATGSGSETTFYSGVSSQGLRLQIMLNASEVSQGGALQAHMLLVNTLPENLTLHPNFTANPNIDQWNWDDYLCGMSPVEHSFGFALLQGHYTAENMSQAGAPLMLAPPVTSYCPNSGYAEAYIQNVEFAPNSDTAMFSANSSHSDDFKPLTINMQLNATTGRCTNVPYQYTETNTVGGVVTTETGTAYSQSCGSNGVDSLTGYWDPIADCSPLFCFHQFPAGPYTIVAEDLWNQTAFGYFDVKTMTIPGTGAASDPSALELRASVYPNPYYYGAPSYDVDVWEFNPLPVMNNVSTVSNWEPNGVYAGGCDPGWPVGVELLRGHYVASNLSGASPVLLNFTSTCPSSIIPTSSLSFLPNSSSAIIKGAYPDDASPTRRTWTYYYYELGPGDYTVVARDEWGHMAFGYFAMAG